MEDKAPILRQELQKEGYSKEEEYFYHLNRELIEQRRKILDSERNNQQINERKNLHWMKCPKCGSRLEESNLLGICVEQCTNCRGIFINPGEIETLIKTKKPGTFFKKLKKLFEPREDFPTFF